MKRSLYRLIGVVLLSLVFVQVHARKRDGDVEKRRVIEKGYTVKENVKLNIKNSFGSVHVNTNDGHDINVRVEVIARKKSVERAMELLDNIVIDISESGSEITFETGISGSLNSKASESFEINYEITMPRSNPLKLKNSFGDVYVGDLDGDCDIQVSYGDIKLGAMNGETKFKLSFGDAEVQKIAVGEIVIKYSDANFKELGVVRFEQGFSNVEIEEANTMDLKCKYGNMTIGSVVGLKGNLGFTDFGIGYLRQELILETSYAGSFTVDRVSKTFSNIDLSGKFGGYSLEFEDGTNADFDIEVKFSDLDLDNTDIDLKYQIKSDVRGEYRGAIGNGGGGKIKITSSYGDVNIL
ncbi:MAG: hypothetical protein OCD76_16805 [Reichenbachiella sp.]